LPFSICPSIVIDRLVQLGLNSLEQVAVENDLLFAVADFALEGRLAEVTSLPARMQSDRPSTGT